MGKGKGKASIAGEENSTSKAVLQPVDYEHSERSSKHFGGSEKDSYSPSGSGGRRCSLAMCMLIQVLIVVVVAGLTCLGVYLYMDNNKKGDCYVKGGEATATNVDMQGRWRPRVPFPGAVCSTSDSPKAASGLECSGTGLCVSSNECDCYNGYFKANCNETNYPTKLVLSVNGGGSSSRVSIRIMQKIESELGISLRDRVDLFAGSGSGAIITNSMAGLYKTSDEIFEEFFSDVSLNGWMSNGVSTPEMVSRPKYDGVGLKSKTTSLFGDLTFSQLDTKGKFLCNVGYDMVQHKMTIMRSWREFQGALMSDMVMASTAFPVYYPPHKYTFKGKEMYMAGADMVQGNPSLIAFNEAYALWPNSKIKLLNIGSGKDNVQIPGASMQNAGQLQWILNHLLSMFSSQTLVNENINALIPKELLLQVNGPVSPIASISFDDISPDHLVNLDKLADKWWLEQEGTIRAFFATLED
eukprot:Nk52_evm41s1360 gene=Nk52_evmTU41s1360